MPVLRICITPSVGGATIVVLVGCSLGLFFTCIVPSVGCIIVLIFEGALTLKPLATESALAPPSIIGFGSGFTSGDFFDNFVGTPLIIRIVSAFLNTVEP